MVNFEGYIAGIYTVKCGALRVEFNVEGCFLSWEKVISPDAVTCFCLGTIRGGC